jgi:hypothetical protein
MARKPPITPRRADQTYQQGVSPEIELLVGRAIITWSNLEIIMQEVIWTLLRVSVDEGRIMTSNLDAKYRMNLLRELGRYHLKHQQLADLLETLGHCEDLYGDRNLIAHGQWVTMLPDNIPAVLSLREKLPNDVDRRQVIASTMPKDRLEAIIDNMIIATNDLIALRRASSRSYTESLKL